MKGYFVIGCTADGLTFDGPLTEADLLGRLAEGYYGTKTPKFLGSKPAVDKFCVMMSEDELLIIEGAIVQPEPVTTVTRWQMP